MMEEGFAKLHLGFNPGSEDSFQITAEAVCPYWIYLFLVWTLLVPDLVPAL